MSPSEFAVTSPPRPTTRIRRSAISALPRIHDHHPAAGDPNDRPVPARQVIHAVPGIPARASTRGNRPVPQLPDDINGTDQALHSARTPSAGHHSPMTGRAPRDRKPGSGQDPHKIPTPHAAHRPHQHHTDITARHRRTVDPFRRERGPRHFGPLAEPQPDSLLRAVILGRPTASKEARKTHSAVHNVPGTSASRVAGGD